MPTRTLLICLLIFCFAGCGGGGDGDSQDTEDDDPIAAIVGLWTGYGLLSGGFWEMSVADDGAVTGIVIDGAIQTAAGTFAHLGGRPYAVNLVPPTGDPREFRMLIDAAGLHAAFFEVFPSTSMAALQKGASAPGNHDLSDYLGQWAGQGAAFDAAGELTLLGASDVEIRADGSFDGTFEALQFQDDAGNTGDPLVLHFPNGRALEGSYTDDDGATAASELYVVITPDEAFIAAVAYDTTAGRPLFFTAWSRP